MPKYIDVEELLRKPPDIHDYYDESGDRDSSHGYSVATIKAAPTLSPDEVRDVGEWVDKGVRAWSCSCCGTPLNHIRQFASFEKNELPNYCPNCGARMTRAEAEKAMKGDGKDE